MAQPPSAYLADTPCCAFRILYTLRIICILLPQEWQLQQFCCSWGQVLSGKSFPSRRKGKAALALCSCPWVPSPKLDTLEIFASECLGLVILHLQLRLQMTQAGTHGVVMSFYFKPLFLKGNQTKCSFTRQFIVFFFFT